MRPFCDHLGALSDGEEQQCGGYSKTDQFSVCALRGCGVHKAALATGTYGADMEHCLLRQGKGEKYRLRRKKVRFIITNRVEGASEAGRFCYNSGEGGEDAGITLSDFFSVDGANHKAFYRDGEKSR